MSMKSIPAYNNTVLFSAFVLGLGSLKRASFECSETLTGYKDKKKCERSPPGGGPLPLHVMSLKDGFCQKCFFPFYSKFASFSYAALSAQDNK